jgi:hypothetical protein
MLPPTISTTPNSPSVCANVRTAAESTPGHASGSSMRRNACQRDSPQHCAASRTSCGIAAKARCSGCTANGMLTITDATTSPAKLNASGAPNARVNASPSELCAPSATSR